MARLTPSPKQAETLQHIRQFIAEKGYSPTVAELAEMAGINCNAAQDRITILDRKGLITKAAGAGRTIRPADDQSPTPAGSASRHAHS
ncbi:LexA repressor [compost metagenome]